MSVGGIVGTVGLWMVVVASPDPTGLDEPSDEPTTPQLPGPDDDVDRPSLPNRDFVDRARNEPAGSPADADSPGSRPVHAVPAVDFEAHAGVAPGGYYGFGVILERPPRDGRNEVVVGSILVPLGMISTVTSAVGAWLAVPEHCVERMASVRIEIEDPERCTGMFTLGIVRTVYGALMLGSGATVLGIGLIRRQRYRRWRWAHGMRARVTPILRGGLGAGYGGVRVRF